MITKAAAAKEVEVPQTSVVQPIKPDDSNLKIPALRAKPNKTVLPNGSPDAAFLVERVVDAWDDLQEKVEALKEGDKEKIEEYFNALIEDEDDLGTALFGTAEDFDSRVKFLGTEN